MNNDIFLMTRKKIAGEIIGYPSCKLSRSRKNAVPGTFLISAKLVFISERQGNEDEKGKPFVGAAGRVLSIAMEKAGIKRPSRKRLRSQMSTTW
jgi:uracil-DNA glycosylase